MQWLEILYLIIAIYLLIAVYFIVLKRGSAPVLFGDVKFLFYATVMFSAFVLIHGVVRKEQATQERYLHRIASKEVLSMEGWLRAVEETPELFPVNLLTPDNGSQMICQTARDCTKMASLANQFFLSVDRVLSEIDQTGSQISVPVAKMWQLFMSPSGMKQFWYKARPWYPVRTQQVLDQLAATVS